MVVPAAWNETVLDLLRRLQDARRLRLVLNVVLLLAIAHGLATLTWVLVPAPRMAAPPPQAVAAPAAAPESGAVRVAAMHLFGTAPPQGANGAPIHAPETTLKLVLAGVLAASDARAARAIIRAPDGTEKPYRVGDLLPGNATLKEIYPDHVLLERNGRYETLPLPREHGIGGGQQSAPTAHTGEGVARALRAYRRKLVSNPASVFQLLRVIPAQQDGQFVGFRVFPTREKALFRRVGLRPGDLVTSVNGIALDNPRSSMKALEVLRSANDIHLSVLRNGRAVRLNLNLNP